jgi:hypothetical protein
MGTARVGLQLRQAIMQSRQLHLQVDRALRRNVQSMAYLAMRTARSLIVIRNQSGRRRRSFRQVNGQRTAISYPGGGPGGRYSFPGESPTNQYNVLRTSIIYEWARQPGTPIESIAGARALTGKGFTDGMASRALEHGGVSRNKSGRLVNIAARPFMAPSNPVVVRSLAQIWANSIPVGRVVAPIYYSTN